MIAYSTASGGVMFMPEKPANKKQQPISYSELTEQKEAQEKESPFGKKKNPVNVEFPSLGVINV
jgi:hypothetical protein